MVCPASPTLLLTLLRAKREELKNPWRPVGFVLARGEAREPGGPPKAEHGRVSVLR